MPWLIAESNKLILYRWTVACGGGVYFAAVHRRSGEIIEDYSVSFFVRVYEIAWELFVWYFIG